MYAKVFDQIFDSSISKDYVLRHVFMDLLVLADAEGVIDKTLDAIARRTNVPIDVIANCIKQLMAPDPSSRSSNDEGRRLRLISDHRDWGWVIINYEEYRKIRDEEGRRSYHRNYMRTKRQAKSVKVCEGVLTPVKACDAPLTNAEEEEEAYMPPSAERALGESLHGEKKKKPRGDPANRYAFKKLWRERYQAVFGSPYLPSDGKDDAQADKLLALPGCTPESLMAVFEKAWVQKDNAKAFYCKHSVSIAKAVQFFNEINSEVGNLKAITNDFIPRKL